MANKPSEANFFPDVPTYPEIGTFQPIYGKFDLTTYIQGASDYEIMAFLVGKYNATLEGYGTVTKLSTETIEAAHQLQDWINNWFDNLDIQQELNNKIDSMVADGTFGTLLHQTFDTQINQQTTNTVTAWLVANVTPTGSAVVVDKSLSISGAAADANETGIRTTSPQNMPVNSKSPFFYARTPKIITGNGTLCNENLLIITNEPVSKNGITITKNATGTYSISGTATITFTETISNIAIPAGRYVTSTNNILDINGMILSDAFTLTTPSTSISLHFNANTSYALTFEPYIYSRKSTYSTYFIPNKTKTINGNDISYTGMNYFIDNTDNGLTLYSSNGWYEPWMFGLIAPYNIGNLQELDAYCHNNHADLQFEHNSVLPVYEYTGQYSIDFNFSTIYTIYNNGLLINANTYRPTPIIKNLLIDCHNTNTDGIIVNTNINGVNFEHITIRDFTTNGIHLIGGAGIFSDIMIYQTTPYTGIRVGIAADAPDAFFTKVRGVNVNHFITATANLRLHDIHPFMTWDSLIPSSQFITSGGTSIIIDDSYCDTYQRCFMNRTNAGSSFIMCGNTIFFWSAQYYTGDKRPSICYDGTHCYLSNCRIYRPRGTTQQTLLYGEAGSLDTVHIALENLNVVEGLARRPSINFINN